MNIKINFEYAQRPQIILRSALFKPNAFLAYHSNLAYLAHCVFKQWSVAGTA